MPKDGEPVKRSDVTVVNASHTITSSLGSRLELCAPEIVLVDDYIQSGIYALRKLPESRNAESY